MSRRSRGRRVTSHGKVCGSQFACGLLQSSCIGHAAAAHLQCCTTMGCNLRKQSRHTRAHVERRATATALPVAAVLANPSSWLASQPSLAACRHTRKQRLTPCGCLSIVPLANGPKRSMGHFLGAEKGIFLIRGHDATRAHGGHAGGILSIPARDVSLGSPRVGTIHVQSPTPHTPPLQSFLVDFSQQTTPLWQ